MVECWTPNQEVLGLSLGGVRCCVLEKAKLTPYSIGKWHIISTYMPLYCLIPKKVICMIEKLLTGMLKHKQFNKPSCKTTEIHISCMRRPPWPSG